ncbi:MAG: cyanophycinase [Chthoniobacteraceae bacterium]
MSRVASGEEAAPRGHLVVVGGGKTNPEITRKALDLAGGTKARVVILPQASELPDTGEKSTLLWRELGAQTVVAIKDLGAAEARREIEAAGVIWMPGGSQNKLAGAIRDAGLEDLIRTRYRDGAVVGGTSAGAAVISQLMITGEADLRSITSGATKTAEGLGLWPEVIVDQHFVKRQRFARLVSAVLDHPDKIGVGIDEETAVIVTGGEWRVLGSSSVIVIDARDAKRGDSKPGAIASATDLRVHVLKAGMTWKPSARP